jgi:hypothetical protein
MKQKKLTEEAKQKIWEERFKKRASEKARLEHEDSLKFFQVNTDFLSPVKIELL